jgi:hypothetical protein
VRADPASFGGQFTAGLLTPSAIAPPGIKGGSARRYGVYRNNVAFSLVRAMEANFPVVRRLLGEEYFAGLARECVQKHPPRSPLLFEFGEDLAAFIDGEEGLRDYPYLGDVARLEQRIRISYHEADAPCLAPNALTLLPPDELMLTSLSPHPAMGLVASPYALYDIYRANRSETVGAVDDLSAAQSVLITRPALDVELHSLTLAQLAFFSALAGGKPFGDAVEEGFATGADFDVAVAISLLLASGAFQPLNNKKDPS